MFIVSRFFYQSNFLINKFFKVNFYFNDITNVDWDATLSSDFTSWNAAQHLRSARKNKIKTHYSKTHVKYLYLNEKKRKKKETRSTYLY